MSGKFLGKSRLEPGEETASVANDATAWRGLLRSVERRLARFLPDETYVNRQFARKFGFRLDLRHPRMFVEKIHWLKLHDCTPLHTQCADKIRVREYVAATVGEDYLIPSLLTTYDPDDLTPERVTAERFVVKTNHDYDNVVVCRDRATFDWHGTRERMRARLARNWYASKRERAYRDIKPGVIVETFLDGVDGRDVDDLKIYCFHGRAELIQQISGRFTTTTLTMYDRDWQRLDVHRRGTPSANEPQPRPPRLAEMLDVAERLAAPFRFARVDLYDSGGKTWFGEITFYPGAGMVLFDPIEYEYAYGALLHLPIGDDRSDAAIRVCGPGPDVAKGWR